MSLLNATELCRVLGISRSTYLRRKRAGELRDFETRQPLGQKRYSSVLVEKFLARESVVRIGAGARSR